MQIIAIDPGNIESAFVVYDTETRKLDHFAKWENETIIGFMKSTGHDYEKLIIEEVKSYGMPAGESMFKTCQWTGEFIRIAKDRDIPWELMPRKTVVTQLCGSSKGKDSNVRQRLVDMWGGKDKAIGKKASQGPLYGVKADVWQALGLAVAWAEINGTN